MQQEFIVKTATGHNLNYTTSKLTFRYFTSNDFTESELTLEQLRHINPELLSVKIDNEFREVNKYVLSDDTGILWVDFN